MYINDNTGKSIRLFGCTTVTAAISIKYAALYNAKADILRESLTFSDAKQRKIAVIKRAIKELSELQRTLDDDSKFIGFIGDKGEKRKRRAHLKKYIAHSIEDLTSKVANMSEDKMAVLKKELELFWRAILALLLLTIATAFVNFVGLPALGLTGTLICSAIGAVMTAIAIYNRDQETTCGFLGIFTSLNLGATISSGILSLALYITTLTWLPVGIIALGCLTITACEWGMGLSYEIISPNPRIAEVEFRTGHRVIREEVNRVWHRDERWVETTSDPIHYS